MSKANGALQKYVASGRKQIPGWLSRVDAEIIKTVFEFQDRTALKGAVAEIGVHFGKCFVELCLGLNDGEKAYAIDIFEDQHLNKDASGGGGREGLLRNVASFGIDADKVILDGRSSEDVKASDIRSAVGDVRFFSVDGGHWLELVENDLKLAEDTLAQYGVIALDDFHRPEWPDVSAGYFGWYGKRTQPFVPIAIGFNKLYIAHQDWAVRYREALETNEFLSAFASKRSVFQGQDLLVYQRYLVQELPVRNVAQVLMSTFTPGAFVWATKRLFRRPNLSSISERSGH